MPKHSPESDSRNPLFRNKSPKVSSVRVSDELITIHPQGHVSVLLPCGETFLLDEQDVHLVRSKYVRIHRVRSDGSYVTVGTTKSERQFLHRLILAPDPGFEVDHRNRNGLDCRRVNLRLCTHSQNCANRRKTKDSTGQFRGIFQQKSGKWAARITVSGKTIYLGTFETDIDAAEEYDRAAVKHFGEFAALNFPDETPLSIPSRTNSGIARSAVC